MPGGDRRGPLGGGPGTGRGAGFCGGNASPGYMNRGGARIFGMGGRGFRCAFRNGWLPGWLGFGRFFTGEAPQYSKVDEVRMLKGQSEYLSNALEKINLRISEIENNNSK